MVGHDDILSDEPLLINCSIDSWTKYMRRHGSDLIKTPFVRGQGDESEISAAI